MACKVCQGCLSLSPARCRDVPAGQFPLVWPAWSGLSVWSNQSGRSIISVLSCRIKSSQGAEGPLGQDLPRCLECASLLLRVSFAGHLPLSRLCLASTSREPRVCLACASPVLRQCLASESAVVVAHAVPERSRRNVPACLTCLVRLVSLLGPDLLFVSVLVGQLSQSS